MTIDELYNATRNIDLYAMRDEVLKQLDHIIIDTITETQLQYGIDGKGQSLPTYANSGYAEKKQKQNPKSEGHYDLHDTGDWYAGLFQEVTGEAIIIDSTDSKNGIINNMMEGYSFKSLTPENFDKIQQENAIPLFMETFKKATGIEG